MPFLPAQHHQGKQIVTWKRVACMQCKLEGTEEARGPTACSLPFWAAWYTPWLLIKIIPKGAV